MHRTATASAPAAAAATTVTLSALLVAVALSLLLLPVLLAAVLKVRRTPTIPLRLSVTQRGAAAQPHGLHPPGQSDGASGSGGHHPAGEPAANSLECCTFMRCCLLQKAGPVTQADTSPPVCLGCKRMRVAAGSAA